jgi:excisionase family DNA binding protein
MNTKGAAKTVRDAVPVRLMTVREVSAYLQVHPSTIYRMLRCHQIPAFHVGCDWRFSIETIDSWCLEKEKLGG